MVNTQFESNKFHRFEFNVSPTEPILLLDDFYSDKSENFYDIHYEYEVGIVLKGSVIRKYKGQQKTLLPGEVWVTGIWESHGFELEETPSEMVVFILSPEGISKVLPMGFNWIKIFSQDSCPIPKIDEKFRQPILDACRELKEAVGKKSELSLAWKANILAKILLYIVESNIELCSQLNSLSREIVEHDMIKNVVDLIFSTNGMVTVNEAARQSMMSTSHFSRLFKEATGVTFARFALGHRVKQSAIALTDTNDHIKKIASDWGFIDSSHYTKTFEKYFGITPSVFRQQSRKNKKTRGVTTTYSI
jgi:AraC-like DNA-binding protein